MEDKELEDLIEAADVETLDLILQAIKERKKNETTGVAVSGSLGRLCGDEKGNKEATDRTSENVSDTETI